MRTRLMITSAMTPTEQRVGRFLRAPDGHDNTPATTVEVEAAPTVPEPPAKSTDDLYDEDYGGAVVDEEGGEEGGDDEPPAAKPEEEVKPKEEAKPENDVEKRIGDITAELRETQRQLAEERRLREEASKPKEETKGEQVAGPPDPKDYEFGDADAKFIADNARWHADQRFDERIHAQKIEEKIAQIETGWKGAIEVPELVEEYPDFKEKVTAGAASKAWACSPTMAILIKNSPVGPHVAYELASNADESRRIYHLSDEEQLLEFGRLEGRMTALRAAAKPAAPAPKKVPDSAPPPPEARSRGNGGKFATEGDALYERMLKEFN